MFHFSRLILIADKYNFAGLVSLCEASLAKNLNIDNALDVTRYKYYGESCKKGEYTEWKELHQETSFGSIDMNNPRKR